MPFAIRMNDETPRPACRRAARTTSSSCLVRFLVPSPQRKLPQLHMFSGRGRIPDTQRAAIDCLIAPLPSARVSHRICRCCPLDPGTPSAVLVGPVQSSSAVGVCYGCWARCCCCSSVPGKPAAFRGLTDGKRRYAPSDDQEPETSAQNGSRGRQLA